MIAGMPVKRPQTTSEAMPSTSDVVAFPDVGAAGGGVYAGDG
jgi:hypothetical protein